MSFKVSAVQSGERQIDIEASVLPKVITNLPTHPISHVTKWKHLSDLEIADPDYGTPARGHTILEEKSLIRQSFMDGGLVPPRYRQCLRPARLGIEWQV